MTLIQTAPKHIYMAKEEVVSDMQGPCKAGFHIPTNNERQLVYNIGVSLGIWSSSSGDGFKTYLKMPYAGFRSGADSYGQKGERGRYWSSVSRNTNYAYDFYIVSGQVANQSDTKNVGISIRAFKDTPVIPDSSWTALYSDKIYHNASLGLISISYDRTTRYTLADKNVGATAVYNSGDTLSESNCGKYYQRGNNYGFPYTGSVTTSSTVVNASTYGPGNYYSSSTFITTNPRDSSDNTNLRGGVTQGSGTAIVDTDIKAVYLGETKVRPPYTPRTFTITRTEKSDMSSGWTYSDDAAGLTAGDTAFDEFFGYYGCRLNASGVETAKITQEESGGAGKLDITQLGTLTSGDNVMIAFPVMGIKMSKSGSTVTLSITKELDKDGYQYYAHSTGTLSNPGTPKDVFYLGAYKGYNNSSVLKSWSGVNPTANITITNSCTYAKNNGTGYNICGYYQRMYIDALYMMKYGNPLAKNVVGSGVSGGSKRNTGGTDSSSNATYSETSYNQIKLFGVEDFRGNLSERLGGVYGDSSRYMYTQLSGWSGTTSGGEQAGILTSTSGMSYPNLSGILGDNKTMFATAANMNDRYHNQYYGAYVRTYSGNTFPITSGAYNEGVNVSIFKFAFGYTTDANVQIGARLMYL